MALSSRERRLSLAVLLAAGIFLCDRVALRPYLDGRRELVERRDAKTRELVEARKVLREERRLRHVLIGLSGSARSDVSAAEGRFLALLHEWEQKAGIAKASFQRTRGAERYGFTHLTFQVTASGPMPAVATLVYLVESAPVPLRIDELLIAPAREAGSELHLQFSVSMVCRQVGPGSPGRAPETGVAAVEPNGGRR